MLHDPVQETSSNIETNIQGYPSGGLKPRVDLVRTDLATDEPLL